MSVGEHFSAFKIQFKKIICIYNQNLNILLKCEITIVNQKGQTSRRISVIMLSTHVVALLSYF